MSRAIHSSCTFLTLTCSPSKADLALKLANKHLAAAANHAGHAHEHTQQLIRRASTRIFRAGDGAEHSDAAGSQPELAPSEPRSVERDTSAQARRRPLAKAGAGGPRHALSPRVENTGAASDKV